MNLRQLQHFLAVVEHGSLGRAAEAIHLSQPALSKSIQKLEEAYQAKLLDRTPLGMTPTEVGQVLIRHARTIETELWRAKNNIDEMRGASVGLLTVGAGPVVGLELLPTVVRRLMRTYPGVRIALVEGMGTALMAGLRAGELDFTIAGHVDAGPTVDLVGEDLYRDQTLVVARRGHPLAEKDGVTLDDLLEARWVLPRRPDTVRQYLDDLFQGLGVEPPQPEIETNSIPFMRSILTSTDSLSFLPAAVFAWTDPARPVPDLVALDQELCVWDRAVRLTRRRHGTVSPPAGQFVRELRSVVAESIRPPTGIGLR